MINDKNINKNKNLPAKIRTFDKRKRRSK